MSENNSNSFNLNKWLKKTSNRIFIAYPIAILMLELLIHRGDLDFVFWGLALVPWGYLQFRLSGQYRNRIGGGGPGFDVPPERLVTSGIYAWTRNPMYLGQLIFLTGIAISFWSLPAAALVGYHIPWYRDRVAEDEQRLSQMFAQDYVNYMGRVKRWMPILF